jgi:hypothetical protein
MAGNFLSYTSSSLETSSFSLIINSTDKLSGTNNNGTYQVNWDDFLPRNYINYKVAFTFQTTGGNYKDGTYNSIATVFSSATIRINWGGRSYSFDTSTKSPSINLGVIQRDIQTSTSSSNTLGCYYLYNPPRTIARPNQNIITVSIYNQSTGGLLVDTTTAPTLLTDMTNWTGYFEFIPIADSKVALL